MYNIYDENIKRLKKKLVYSQLLLFVLIILESFLTVYSKSIH